jgi:hypothetical protein
MLNALKAFLQLISIEETRREQLFFFRRSFALLLRNLAVAKQSGEGISQGKTFKQALNTFTQDTHASAVHAAGKRPVNFSDTDLGK